MKIVVVDDEPAAIELIQKYLSKFDFCYLVASYRNGLHALQFLKSNSIDLLFLDINMRFIDGLELAKLIPPETKIIFITSYAEFALESYEIGAIDYLLKPISFERFEKSLFRAKDLFINDQWVSSEIYMIKSGSQIHRVEMESILYLAKDGNYMIYHLPDQKILARETIQEALDKLPDHFFQIHKSYIINKRQVNSFDREQVMIGMDNLPIGQVFRKEALERLSE